MWPPYSVRSPVCCCLAYAGTANLPPGIGFVYLSLYFRWTDNIEPFYQFNEPIRPTIYSRRGVETNIMESCCFVLFFHKLSFPWFVVAIFVTVPGGFSSRYFLFIVVISHFNVSLVVILFIAVLITFILSAALFHIYLSFTIFFFVRFPLFLLHITFLFSVIHPFVNFLLNGIPSCPLYGYSFILLPSFIPSFLFLLRCTLTFLY